MPSIISRNPRIIARNLSAVLALCLLTACGFHLRNQNAMPTALQPLYIGGPASAGALAGQLRYQLNNNDTAIVRSSAKANYRLMLLSEGSEQRIISLDRRGLAAEYGLIASIEFELYDRANHRVLGPLRLQELRTVTNNPDNALTTSQEILLVRSDINKALAAQLTRRLGAYAKHMPPLPAVIAPEPPQIGTPKNEVPGAGSPAAGSPGAGSPGAGTPSIAPTPSSAPPQPPSAL